MKMQLPELETIEDKQILQSLFGNITYIWIRRRDKTRQAVSWAKAAQTKIQPKRRQRQSILQFNFPTYQSAIKADVVKVYYEDLVEQCRPRANSYHGSLPTK